MVTWDYIDYYIDSINTKYKMKLLYPIEGVVAVGNYVFTRSDSFEQDLEMEYLMFFEIKIK